MIITVTDGVHYIRDIEVTLNGTTVLTNEDGQAFFPEQSGTLTWSGPFHWGGQMEVEAAPPTPEPVDPSIVKVKTGLNVPSHIPPPEWYVDANSIASDEAHVQLGASYEAQTGVPHTTLPPHTAKITDGLFHILQPFHPPEIGLDPNQQFGTPVPITCNFTSPGIYTLEIEWHVEVFCDCDIPTYWAWYKYPVTLIVTDEEEEPQEPPIGEHKTHLRVFARPHVWNQGLTLSDQYQSTNYVKPVLIENPLGFNSQVLSATFSSPEPVTIYDNLAMPMSGGYTVATLATLDIIGLYETRVYLPPGHLDLTWHYWPCYGPIHLESAGPPDTEEVILKNASGTSETITMDLGCGGWRGPEKYNPQPIPGVIYTDTSLHVTVSTAATIYAWQDGLPIYVGQHSAANPATIPVSNPSFDWEVLALAPTAPNTVTVFSYSDMKVDISRPIVILTNQDASRNNNKIYELVLDKNKVLPGTLFIMDFFFWDHVQYDQIKNLKVQLGDRVLEPTKVVPGQFDPTSLEFKYTFTVDDLPSGNFALLDIGYDNRPYIGGHWHWTTIIPGNLGPTTACVQVTTTKHLPAVTSTPKVLTTELSTHGRDVVFSPHRLMEITAATLHLTANQVSAATVWQGNTPIFTGTLTNVAIPLSNLDIMSFGVHADRKLTEAELDTKATSTSPIDITEAGKYKIYDREPYYDINGMSTGTKLVRSRWLPDWARGRNQVGYHMGNWYPGGIHPNTYYIDTTYQDYLVRFNIQSYLPLGRTAISPTNRDWPFEIYPPDDVGPGKAEVTWITIGTKPVPVESVIEVSYNELEPIPKQIHYETVTPPATISLNSATRLIYTAPIFEELTINIVSSKQSSLIEVYKDWEKIATFTNQTEVAVTISNPGSSDIHIINLDNNNPIPFEVILTGLIEGPYKIGTWTKNNFIYMKAGVPLAGIITEAPEDLEIELYDLTDNTWKPLKLVDPIMKFDDFTWITKHWSGPGTTYAAVAAEAIRWSALSVGSVTWLGSCEDQGVPIVVDRSRLGEADIRHRPEYVHYTGLPPGVPTVVAVMHHALAGLISSTVAVALAMEAIDTPEAASAIAKHTLILNSLAAGQQVLGNLGAAAAIEGFNSLIPTATKTSRSRVTVSSPEIRLPGIIGENIRAQASETGDFLEPIDSDRDYTWIPSRSFDSLDNMGGGMTDRELPEPPTANIDRSVDTDDLFAPPNPATSDKPRTSPPVPGSTDTSSGSRLSPGDFFLDAVRSSPLNQPESEFDPTKIWQQASVPTNMTSAFGSKSARGRTGNVQLDNTPTQKERLAPDFNELPRPSLYEMPTPGLLGEIGQSPEELLEDHPQFSLRYTMLDPVVNMDRVSKELRRRL